MPLFLSRLESMLDYRELCPVMLLLILLSSFIDTVLDVLKLSTTKEIPRVEIFESRSFSFILLNLLGDSYISFSLLDLLSYSVYSSYHIAYLSFSLGIFSS